MSGAKGEGPRAARGTTDPAPGPFVLSDVRFGPDGLVPVVFQDASSGRVLMLAHANEEALRLTLESGRAHYYSRSRQELWRKGDTSGNHQFVGEVALDCDGDAVLYRGHAAGPACHTGEESCFYRHVSTGSPDATAGTASYAAFELLDRVVAQRLRELPAGSYVTALRERGRGYMAQKVVEEAGETIVAALEGQEEELLGESADLLFHLCVLLQESGLTLAQVSDLLVRRHGDRSSPDRQAGST